MILKSHYNSIKMLQRLSILASRNAVEVICENGQKVILSHNIDFINSNYQCTMGTYKNWAQQNITLKYQHPNYDIHACLPKWCSWVDHKVVDNSIISPFIFKEKECKLYHLNKQILNYNSNMLQYFNWILKIQGNSLHLNNNELHICLTKIAYNMHVKIEDGEHKHIMINYELL